MREHGRKRVLQEKSDEFRRTHTTATKQEWRDVYDALFSTPAGWDSFPIGMSIRPSAEYSIARFGGSGPLDECCFVVTSDGYRPEEAPGFDIDQMRERLEVLAVPGVFADSLHSKARDDKAAIAVGRRVSLLPDDILLPEAGRHVMSANGCFEVVSGSAIPSLDGHIRIDESVPYR